MAAHYWIGTSGWTYDHWKGDFYPSDLPKSRWFQYYANKFNSVEINATFYRWFQDSTYEKWRTQVPDNFRYTLKAPRLITHRKYLKDADEDIRNFARSADLLENRFGLILLQLAPGTGYHLDLLRHTLLEFGDPSRVAVEFRNQRWLTPETDALLQELGAVWCDVDSPSMGLTGKVTSRSGYIRLHGPGQWYASDYSEADLQAIAGTARGMASQGAEDIYIYFNNDLGGYAHRNAQRIQEILREG
jgi:uncharacterized protein YecE (DUF72 family)